MSNSLFLSVWHEKGPTGSEKEPIRQRLFFFFFLFLERANLKNSVRMSCRLFKRSFKARIPLAITTILARGPPCRLRIRGPRIFQRFDDKALGVPVMFFWEERGGAERIPKIARHQVTESRVPIYQVCLILYNCVLISRKKNTCYITDHKIIGIDQRSELNVSPLSNQSHPSSTYWRAPETSCPESPHKISRKQRKQG